MKNFHTFQYNGKYLYELGAVIAQRPQTYISNRDIGFESIPGRSGDIPNDNGRYDNISFQIAIRAVPAFCNLNLQDFTYRLSEWLCVGDYDYKEYRDTYNPGYFRKAVCTDISDVTAVKRDVFETTVTFNCDPFLYSDVGLQTVTYTSNSSHQISAKLLNPEQWHSEPIITVSGETQLTLAIGGKSVSVVLSEDVNKIIIDKPSENVYDADGNSCNDKVGAMALPYLQPGINTINAIGLGDFSLKITPNWRRL